MLMGIVFHLLVSPVYGGDGKFVDELQDLKAQLVAVNSTKDQLADEIANLEKLSSERARKIKEMKERLAQARRDLAQRLDEASSQRKHADALESELRALQADVRNVEDLHKSEMNSLEAQRKAELLKKEQLTQMAAQLHLKKKKNAETRAVAQEQLAEIQRENQRLYDQIKSRSGTRIRTTGETAPE